MKITNRHVGYFIWVTLAVIATIYSYNIDLGKDGSTLKPLILIFTIPHHIFIVFVFITSLIKGNIEFEFQIPNPFKSMINAYTQKREYLKELKEIHHLMAKSKSIDELDLLIKKKEFLESLLNL